jgi:predicted N-acetyltransferase YhbS
MKITLRPEEPQDYRTVEELTREAFWNVHFPGCDEHLLVHIIRTAKEFIRELDFIAVCNSKIVGNIMYAQASVKDHDTEHRVLTFGPLSVLPEYQNRGIGSTLINHTLELVRKMEYRAVIIYGDPEYYKRFGFRVSKEFHITNKDNKYPAALLVLELYADALHGTSGVFDEGAAYKIDEKELEKFERGFAQKEKSHTKSQERFIELSNTFL